MHYLALQSRDELSVLREDRKIEVVVVVGDCDFSSGVDSNTDRVVGDACRPARLKSYSDSLLNLKLTFSSDLPKKVSFIIKYFYTVSSVVTDEYLLSVIDHDTVGELQMFGAAELVKNVPHLVKDDHPHHLQSKEWSCVISVSHNLSEDMYLLMFYPPCTPPQ